MQQRQTIIIPNCFQSRQSPEETQDGGRKQTLMEEVKEEETSLLRVCEMTFRNTSELIFSPMSCVLLVTTETDTPSLWDVPLRMDPAASEHQHVFSCGG